jgi:hypothetical protein
MVDIEGINHLTLGAVKEIWEREQEIPKTAEIPSWLKIPSFLSDNDLHGVLYGIFLEESTDIFNLSYCGVSKAVEIGAFLFENKLDIVGIEWLSLKGLNTFFNEMLELRNTHKLPEFLRSHFEFPSCLRGIRYHECRVKQEDARRAFEIASLFFANDSNRESVEFVLRIIAQNEQEKPL